MPKKIILGLITLLPFLVEAQSFYAIRRPRNLAVSGGSGIATYKGELVNPNQLGKVRYNIVVGAEYLLSTRFTVKADLTWFNIAGSDANANDDRVERNLSFKSNNQELNVAGAVYFLKDPKEFYRRSTFNIYAFLGAGLLHMNPKAEYQGRKYALQPLETEGVKYTRFQFIIPYGFGVRLSIDPLHNVIIEGGYRTTFTDYMDDISIRRYPDPTTLKDGGTGLTTALSDRRRERDPDYPVGPNVGVRGNPEQKDGYFLFNIKYQYYLPYEIGVNSESNRFYKRKRKAAFNPKRR
jgi:hypothetical protein